MAEKKSWGTLPSDYSVRQYLPEELIYPERVPCPMGRCKSVCHCEVGTPLIKIDETGYMEITWLGGWRGALALDRSGDGIDRG